MTGPSTITTTITKLGLMLALLTIGPAAQGCFPVLFAAAGAGAGYLATDKDAQDRLNAFLADISTSTRKRTTKVKSEEKTKTSLKGTKGSEPVFELIDYSVKPRKVQRHNQVKIRLEYALLGADSDGAKVTENKSLWHGNKKIAQLASDTVQRTNGTWESTLTFTIPESAENGKHTIKQEVVYKQQKLQAAANFTVY